MADSSAARQRRYRKHAKGDHSLCSAERCPAKAAEAPPITESDMTERHTAPSGPAEHARQPWSGPGEDLERRGARLWADMADADLSPPHRVVLEEACRVADRLDRLDALLSGRDDWLRLRAEEFGSDRVLEVRVVVDNLLGEARQQEAVLRGLVSELRQGLAAARKPSGATAPPSESAATPPGVLSLRGSAAARRRAATT